MATKQNTPDEYLAGITNRPRKWTVGTRPAEIANVETYHMQPDDETFEVLPIRQGMYDIAYVLSGDPEAARLIALAPELVVALRDLKYASEYARANHYQSEFGLRAAEDRASALLAEVQS
jgi:hypothetical protein